MISIRETMEELERCHKAAASLQETYTVAIRNTAQYAVELDTTLTEPFQRELSLLADHIAAAGTEEIEESRSALRSILRSYRDRAGIYLTDLKSELSTTVQAFEEILNSSRQADGDHEKRLRGAIAGLRKVCQSQASVTRETILAAAETIESSVEMLRKEHQFTIAEFASETRLLRQRINQLEHTAPSVGQSGFCSRVYLEQRIVSKPDGEFTLLLLTVKGLRSSERTYGPSVYEQINLAFAKRFRNGLPAGAVAGQWDDEQFVGILPLGESKAAGRAKWAAEHLSGVYVCRADGKTVMPMLNVSAHVLIPGNGESGMDLRERVQHFFC
jgi:GGDEF domain-containing protein